MPYSVVSNRKSTSVVLHFASANTTVLVTGNTATSNIALPGETITGHILPRQYGVVTLMVTSP